MRGGRRLRHAASRLTPPDEGADDEKQPAEEYREWLGCVRSSGSLPACDHLLSERTRLRLLRADDAFLRLLAARGRADYMPSANDTLAAMAPGDNETGLAATGREGEGDEGASFEDEVRDLYEVVMPVMVAACALSLAFNLAIVASARWVRRRTLSPTLYLSLSLAAADAWASLVLGAGFVLNSLLPVVHGVRLGPYAPCYALALEAFRLGALLVSVLHLLALAVNHYVGIVRPLHYAATVTRGAALGAIGAMWAAPMAFFLAYFALVPGAGFQSPRCERADFLQRAPFRATFSTLFFLPLLLMCGMYARMFAVVRRHQRGQLQLREPGDGAGDGRRLNKSVKAVITTLLILGTYLLGWMPAVLYFMLTCFECPAPFTGIPLRTRVPVGIFINSMIVAKSFADPVIYVVRMPEIKQALRAALRLRSAERQADPACHSKTEINRLTTRRVKGDAPSPVNGCAASDGDM